MSPPRRCRFYDGPLIVVDVVGLVWLLRCDDCGREDTAANRLRGSGSSTPRSAAAKTASGPVITTLLARSARFSVNLRP